MTLAKRKIINELKSINWMFFILTIFSFKSEVNAQALLVADSAFEEFDPGYQIHRHTENIQWVIDTIYDAHLNEYWQMSPFGMEWRGNYWGGQDTLKDSMVWVSNLFNEYSYFSQLGYVSRPPLLYCPNDTIRGMYFMPQINYIGGNSGAIALRLTEKLVKGKEYKIPFVYCHDGASRITKRISFQDSLKFNFSVFTSDTSAVYRMGDKYWLPMYHDTLGNYELIERVPYAENDEWAQHWVEFTATDAQDGHDWLILHSGFGGKGIIMDFVNAKRMIDLNLNDDTLVYCSDTTVTLDLYEYIIVDTSIYVHPYVQIYFDTAYYQNFTDAEGCRLMDYSKVLYLDQSVIETSLSDSICQYDSMLLKTKLENFKPTAFLWSDGQTNDSITAQDSGWIWVDVSQGFCKFRDSFHLSYFPTPSFWLGPDSFVCEGDSLKLGLNQVEGESYKWNTGQTDSLIYVDSTFTYKLTIGSKNCEFSDSIDVLKRLRPVVELSWDTTICESDSFLVDLQGKGYQSVDWDDGVSDSVRWFKTNGIFRALINDGFCDITDSVQSFTDPIINLSLGVDSVFCENIIWQKDFTILNADSFQWHDGTKVSSFSTNQSELVWLNVYRGACFSSDTVILTVLPFPFFELGRDTLLCETDSIRIGADRGSFDLVWTDGISDEFRWIKNSEEYTLIMSNQSCSSRDSIQISFDLVEAIELPNDTTICDDKPLFVDGSILTGNLYIWNDGMTGASRSILETGTFILSSETRACGSLSDTISVDVVSCDCFIHYPNAFSPNTDDELNSIYKPYFNCDPESYFLQVFNRWGEVIFESNDKDKGWDGTYKNRNAQDGTYAYVSHYKLPGKIIQSESGYIYLLR